LRVTDWVAIAGYVVLVGLVATWTKARRRGGSEDYFLAGRSQHWFVISIAMFAALFSTISFVAIPGEAFAYGLIYSTGLLVLPLAAPLAIWLFLRFFFLSPTYTSYEYLERRFNLPMRLAGSILFTISQLIYCGVVFYAGAELCEVLVGWRPVMTILLAGSFTVLYTTHGGMRTVIMTDVMQAAVLTLGICAVLWKVLELTGMNPAAIYHFAAAHGRGYGALGSREFYRPELHTRYNVWLVVFLPLREKLAALSSNQLTVQRLLTTNKGYRGAKWATITTSLETVPLVALFWAVGAGLFYYYRGLHPERLPASVGPDQVLGHFIVTELPSPLPGLVLAALLASLMSTTSSAINSSATILYRDGIVRLSWAKLGGARETLICKLLSVAVGIVAVGAGLLLAFGSSHARGSVLEVNTIWSGVTSVLLAAFLLGVLAPFVSAVPMFVGCLAGGVCSLILPFVFYYNVAPAQRISFAWLGVPGLVVAVLVALGLSLLHRQRADMTGLTLWTMKGTVPDTQPPSTDPPPLPKIPITQITR
jgi:SSS family transporter